MNTYGETESFPPGASPDFARALEQLGGDEKGFRELCRTFMQQVPKLRDALLAARAHQVEALLDCLHEVATSLQIVGAGASARSVRTVEGRLREGEPLPAEAVSRHGVRLLLHAAVEVDAFLRRQTMEGGSGEDLGSR